MPHVRVKENEPFEVAMRRFKRSCEKAGVLAEVRRRELSAYFYQAFPFDPERPAELADPAPFADHRAEMAAIRDLAEQGSEVVGELLLFARSDDSAAPHTFDLAALVAELTDREAAGREVSRRGYRVEDRAVLSQMAIASGYLSVLVLALYVPWGPAPALGFGGDVIVILYVAAASAV